MNRKNKNITDISLNLNSTDNMRAMIFNQGLAIGVLAICPKLMQPLYKVSGESMSFVSHTLFFYS